MYGFAVESLHLHQTNDVSSSVQAEPGCKPVIICCSFEPSSFYDQESVIQVTSKEISVDVCMHNQAMVVCWSTRGSFGESILHIF